MFHEKQFHVKQQWKVRNNTNQEGSNRFVDQEGASGLSIGKAAFGLPTRKSTHTDNLEKASSAPLRRVTISKAREGETKREAERAYPPARRAHQQERHCLRLSPAAKS